MEDYLVKVFCYKGLIWVYVISVIEIVSEV